jgi:hypothetical protein
MNDPLAQFRKKPAGSGADATPPTEPGEYLAFDAKDHVPRLRIRRANDPTRSPGYNYLLDVVYDGEFGTNFTLVYTFLMVLVRGRNLQPVVMALEMGTADFIQEFDPDRWQMPKDEKAPFIESIDAVVQDSGSSVADSEQSGNQREKGHTRH